MYIISRVKGGGGVEVLYSAGYVMGQWRWRRGGVGRLVNEVERVGEGGMLISFVDAFTYNMGQIA